MYVYVRVCLHVCMYARACLCACVSPFDKLGDSY